MSLGFLMMLHSLDPLMHLEWKCNRFVLCTSFIVIMIDSSQKFSCLALVSFLAMQPQCFGHGCGLAFLALDKCWIGTRRKGRCTYRDRVRNKRFALREIVRSSLRFELFREVAFGSLAQSVPLLLWRWMRASCFGLRPCYRSFWRQNVLNMTITLAKPNHDSNQGLYEEVILMIRLRSHGHRISYLLLRRVVCVSFFHRLE